MKPDICLISPPLRACEPRLPLSLLTIASWAKKEGIRVDIIDIKTNPFRNITPELKDRVISQILARVKDSNLNADLSFLTALLSVSLKSSGDCIWVRQTAVQARTLVDGSSSRC